MDVGERERERARERVSKQRCQGWLQRVLVKLLERLAEPRGSAETLREARDAVKGWGRLSPKQADAMAKRDLQLGSPWWIRKLGLSVPMGATRIPAQPRERSPSLCSGLGAGLKVVHGRYESSPHILPTHLLIHPLTHPPSSLPTHHPSSHPSSPTSAPQLPGCCPRHWACVHELSRQISALVD